MSLVKGGNSLDVSSKMKEWVIGNLSFMSDDTRFPTINVAKTMSSNRAGYFIRQ